MADEEIAGGGEKLLSSLFASASEHPEKVEDLVKNLAKYEALLTKVSGILDKLNKIGVLPAIIRTVGVSQKIPDIDKPLVNPLSINCASTSHKMLFEDLNKAPEDVIKEMYKQAILQQAKAEKKKK